MCGCSIRFRLPVGKSGSLCLKHCMMLSILFSIQKPREKKETSLDVDDMKFGRSTYLFSATTVAEEHTSLSGRRPTSKNGKENYFFFCFVMVGFLKHGLTSCFAICREKKNQMKKSNKLRNIYAQKHLCVF